jgi:spermidine/putrescine transport system permease protein
MKTKRLATIALTLITVLTVSFTGCSKKKEINLFIWTEYMPKSVLDDFKKEYGVKVNITTFSSISDMYAKIKSSPKGTYDIVDVAERYIDIMGKEDLIEKLDYANIPNIKNVAPSFLKQWYDPSNTYSVPYLGGVATLCYNSKKVPEGISSYEDLFNKKFKNSVVMIKDFQVIIGMVNVMLGFDYNETDPVKLAKTRKKLIELKPNVKLLDSDSPKTALISGEATVGMIYSAEIALAMASNKDIKIAFPKNGQYLFLDSLCIAKDSKNKVLAEKFINFVLEAKTGKTIIESFPYTSPNAEAMKLMDDAFRSNPAKNIPSEAIARGLGIKDLGKTVDLYNDIWTEFTK